MAPLKHAEIAQFQNDELSLEAKRLGKNKKDVLASILKSFFAKKPAYRALELSHLPPKLTGRSL